MAKVTGRKPRSTSKAKKAPKTLAQLTSETKRRVAKEKEGTTGVKAQSVTKVGLTKRSKRLAKIDTLIAESKAAFAKVGMTSQKAKKILSDARKRTHKFVGKPSKGRR